MDLRAMLNTDGGGGGGGDRSKTAHRPPPPPPSITTSATPVPATPATPIQAGPPPHSFRDYSHSTHASPLSQPHEYPPSSHPSHNPPSAGPGHGLYASPTSYHASVGGSYPGRPSVPPLQPLASHDIRSPSSTTLSGPSPYRHTPTSSASASSTGYPFPPTQQPPASPGQRHQYGPPSTYSRDSYSSQPPVGVPPSHGSVSYPQGQQHQQQSVPQTPPVGTPGGSHQYLQQRSLSIHSTPTPTSAHSQHPSYPASYVQGSPVAAQHVPPAHLDQHHRHQSPQPPTPLGPPMTAPRQSPAISYQQPPSPYQQRMSSTSLPYQHMVKASPPPPPPASVPRMPSTGHSAYDAVGESQRRSQSQQSRSERERSLSVSPKTRVPSLPSSTGHSASAEQDPYHPQHRLQPLPPNSVANMQSQRDVTPAKRKIDDRDLRLDEMENQRQPPPPPKINGNHDLPTQMLSRSSTSPSMLRKKRITHSTPPVWAQSGRKRTLIASRNFSLKQHGGTPSTAAVANGTHHETSTVIKAEQVSRHASPEAARSAPIVKEEPNHPAVKDNQPFGGQPFPWEPSIENSRPMEVISRSVADFFVFNILNGPNPEELRARGAQFEIEAKLGTIIDKSTNDRIDFRIQAGECVIGDGIRIAFRSSMTENQHRVLNEYLNEQVKASFPRNPTAASRVQVQYIHRRETDRFFELPGQLRQRLPAPIANLLSPNAPLKARITYDQKTGGVLAKIVKARVADLHIHMPHMPLDCRLSINIEWDWDGPAQEIEQNQIPNKERQPDRNKDRLSYTHGFYQIDLTQVTQGTQGPHGQLGMPTKEHELEIELDSGILYEHGRLLMKNDPNRYADLVDGLVDNMRVLARHCPPPNM